MPSWSVDRSLRWKCRRYAASPGARFAGRYCPLGKPNFILTFRNVFPRLSSIGIHDIVDDVILAKLLYSLRATADVNFDVDILKHPNYVSCLARKADAKEFRGLGKTLIKSTWYIDGIDGSKNALRTLIQRIGWVRVDGVPLLEFWQRIVDEEDEEDWWTTQDFCDVLRDLRDGANGLADRLDRVSGASQQRRRASSLDLVRLSPTCR
jgi:hypothetical protein